MAGSFFEWACFLSRQAAKKALKAVYQRLGAEAFGHSILGLIYSLPDEHRKQFETLLDDAKELGKAYTHKVPQLDT